MVPRIEKREDILKAAARAFLEKGYGAASMDYIAQEANVSKQTIYSHFKNKEELFRGMMEEKCDNLWEPIASGDYESLPPEIFLQKLGETMLTFFLTPEALNIHRLIIAESPRFPELSRLFFELGPKKGLKRIADYMNAQKQRGTMVFDDAQSTARLFVDMIKGSPMQFRLMGLDTPFTAKDIQQHVTESVRVFMAAYGKHN